jgi:hypothetical protein
MSQPANDQTLGDLLLGHPDADWSMTNIGSNTIDRETGEVIPAGWWIAAHAPGEPEDVWLNLHVAFAVDPEGNEDSERIARRLLALLTSPQDAQIKGLRAELTAENERPQ